MSPDEVIQPEILPETESAYLNEKGFVWTATKEGTGFIHIVIKDFPFPGFSPDKANLLIRLPPAYPNANPDMFWNYPTVKRPNGTLSKATESQEAYNGITWQRWSRHMAAGLWRPGIDGLKTYITVIKKEIEKGKIL